MIWLLQIKKKDTIIQSKSLILLSLVFILFFTDFHKVIHGVTQRVTSICPECSGLRLVKYCFHVLSRSRPLPFPSSPPHKKRPPPPGQPYDLILFIVNLIQTKPITEFNQKNIMRYVIVSVKEITYIIHEIHFSEAGIITSRLAPYKVNG
jgi:hypothetical protein